VAAVRLLHARHYLLAATAASQNSTVFDHSIHITSLCNLRFVVWVLMYVYTVALLEHALYESTKLALRVAHTNNSTVALQQHSCVIATVVQINLRIVER
jgi:hypothetical protein